MVESIDAPFPIIASRFEKGTIIPFLGAGVNMVARPPIVDPWKGYPPSDKAVARYIETAFGDAEPASDSWLGAYLPSGRELAEFLADAFGYEESDANDLMQVSLYAVLAAGTKVDLYDKLIKIFNADYPKTASHTMLATLPGKLRNKGVNSPPLLIVTTNYDDVLECAFDKENEAFDVVTYRDEDDEDSVSRFYHHPHPYRDSEPIPIVDGNSYDGLSLESRHTILKIHGTIRRNQPFESSFVITADDYIRYLAKGDISQLIPIDIKDKLVKSSYLFLGYGLRDWNLRVLLYHIWSQRKPNDRSRSWAIQRNVQALERALWENKNVKLVNMELKSFIDQLDAAIDKL